MYFLKHFKNETALGNANCSVDQERLDGCIHDDEQPTRGNVVRISKIVHCPRSRKIANRAPLTSLSTGPRGFIPDRKGDGALAGVEQLIDGVVTDQEYARRCVVPHACAVLGLLPNECAAQRVRARRRTTAGCQRRSLGSPRIAACLASNPKRSAGT
jgi:hypothetical protein